MAQTHSTVRDGKRLTWDTEKLWSQSRSLQPFDLALSSIKELDQDCWFGQRHEPTLREIAAHCQRINAANLELPIILNADGSLMDGGHRVCKALLQGHTTIRAVRFESMPAPDEISSVVE